VSYLPAHHIKRIIAIVGRRTFSTRIFNFAGLIRSLQNMLLQAKHCAFRFNLYQFK